MWANDAAEVAIGTRGESNVRVKEPALLTPCVRGVHVEVVKQDSAGIAFAECEAVAAKSWHRWLFAPVESASQQPRKFTVFMFLTTIRYSWSFRYSYCGR